MRTTGIFLTHTLLNESSTLFRATMVDDLSATFQKMDVDGNGTLSVEEMMPAMRIHFEGKHYIVI